MAQSYIYNQNIFSLLVQELNKLLDEEVIITDKEGVILKSTDLNRIGDFHEGAKLSMRENKQINMTSSLVKKLRGVRKGIVLPIVVNYNPIAVLGITGEPKLIDQQANLVKKIAELFIQDTMQKINQEKQMRDLEFFVFDWLYDVESQQDLKERANFLQLNFLSYHQVILCKSYEKNYDLSYQDIEFFRMFWDQKGDTLVVRWGQNKWLLIVKDMEKEVLKSKLAQLPHFFCKHFQIYISIGVGQKVDAPELYLSLEQAAQAVENTSPFSSVVFEEDLRLELILSEIEEGVKQRFVNRTIIPLKEKDFLLKTLKVWFEQDMSINKTAQVLYVHKNTVHYRLKSIERLTGFSIYKIKDLVQLYLAYVFLNE